MFSASPDPRQRGLRAHWRRVPLALRLTFGYATLFALSAVVLLALSYGLLLGYLRAQDRAYAEAHLRAYGEAYVQGGAPAVERAAAAVREDDRGEELLVRVSDGANRTLLLFLPEDWQRSDVAGLERAAPVVGGRRVVPNAREREEVEVAALGFADGASVEVGMSSDERNDVAEAFPDIVPWILLPLLALALIGGAFMAQRALRPLRHLLVTLRAIIATGDVTARAPEPAVRGELAELFMLFNRTLERIEALVSRLRGTLDDVAHDLRTPLTRLRGMAELALREERDADTYREALAEAVEAADAIGVMLDAIMDVAEAEAGAMRLRMAPVSVTALVRDVADLYELVAEQKGLALDVDADASAWALADRASLGRALANLVDNAVKYTPAGGRVSIRASRNGHGVCLAVRDTGVGIAPDELPHIWDRLYRGDRSRSERGLGLGLSLVRAIVKGHGGQVEVESRLGAGSTFTLHLPGADPAP